MRKKKIEITPLRNEIYAICETGLTETVTSYLILGEDNNILFDTGIGSNKAKIYQAVMKFISHEPTVINSHKHYDHTGGNKYFSEIYAYQPEGCKTTKDNIKPLKLEDGQIFDLGNRVLRVIHTPGHTEDSICLFDETNGILFSGDVIYEGTLYSMFKSDFFGNSDLKDYEDSMAKLENMIHQINIIHPAHNSINVEPQLISHAKTCLGQINKGTAKFKKKRFFLKPVKEYAFKKLNILTD